MTKFRTFTTVLTSCYTHDVAQDQASAGGVHLHQIRKAKDGWRKRIVQSNGRWTAYGPTEVISAYEAVTLIQRAVSRGDLL
jgi:hypothetical protein